MKTLTQKRWYLWYKHIRGKLIREIFIEENCKRNQNRNQCLSPPQYIIQLTYIAFKQSKYKGGLSGLEIVNDFCLCSFSFSLSSSKAMQNEPRQEKMVNKTKWRMRKKSKLLFDLYRDCSQWTTQIVASHEYTRSVRAQPGRYKRTSTLTAMWPFSIIRHDIFYLAVYLFNRINFAYMAYKCLLFAFCTRHFLSVCGMVWNGMVPWLDRWMNKKRKEMKVWNLF